MKEKIKNKTEINQRKKVGDFDINTDLYIIDTVQGNSVVLFPVSSFFYGGVLFGSS